MKKLILSLALLASCAHLDAGSSAEGQVERHDPRDVPACVTFAEPQAMVCLAGGRGILSGQVQSFCQGYFPDRYILTNPEGQSATLVGATCVAAVSGAH